MNAWITLFIAGALEVVWAIALKQSHGFSRLGPSLFALGTMGISFWLLATAMKSLPAGTAYAVWTGVGALGTVILGIVILGEPANIGRMLCLGLILGGIIGLKIAE